MARPLQRGEGEKGFKLLKRGQEIDAGEQLRGQFVAALKSRQQIVHSVPFHSWRK